jgi:peptidoglycan/LPS O-acetylase OafA/YrhL
LAVVLVLVFHVSGSALPNGGFVGVTTFFVLSGFLITSLLLRERETHGRINLKAFYVRRALRLYPPLLVLLVALPVVMLAFHDPNVSTYLPKALFAGFYLSDFATLSGVGMGILTHTWSLAVEEQFYLVWPLLLIVVLSIAKGDRRKTCTLITLVFVAAFAWRILAQLNLDFVRVCYGPDTNFFAMLAGAVLAAVKRLPKLPIWIGALALAGLLVLAFSRPVLGIEPDVFVGWLVTAAAVTALTVVWSASQGSLSVLETGAAKWMGGISYSLYLWHDPILKLRIFGEEVQGGDRVILAASAVFIGWLSWRLVERPTLQWKKEFERSTIR